MHHEQMHPINLKWYGLKHIHRYIHQCHPICLGTPIGTVLVPGWDCSSTVVAQPIWDQPTTPPHHRTHHTHQWPQAQLIHPSQTPNRRMTMTLTLTLTRITMWMMLLCHRDTNTSNSHLCEQLSCMACAKSIPSSLVWHFWPPHSHFQPATPIFMITSSTS